MLLQKSFQHIVLWYGETGCTLVHSLKLVQAGMILSALLNWFKLVYGPFGLLTHVMNYITS